MAEEVRYPWFELVEGDRLQQGDILREFGILVPLFPVNTDDAPEVEVRSFDLVVMTQSCDLANTKARSVLLCPVFDLWAFVDAATKAGKANWGSEQRDKLRQGNLPGYHLINEAAFDGTVWLPVSVVDFHEVHTAPTAIVQSFAGRSGKRLRLCPPYREHLAQAFARFFMRVGLPVDIAAEKLKRPVAT